MSPEFDIEDDQLIVEYPRQLPLGNATLRFHFEGRISEVPNALYRVNDGQQKYLFTQFEPIAARKVFPCFDEPKFKTPFEVSISVPNGVDAVANAPLRVVDTAGTRKVFRFKPTRPLPTYLVAFGVGPFDFVDGGKIGAKGTPFRIVVPKGKSARSAFALAETPKILNFFEDYLDAQYPYQKLDLLAVPNFQSGPWKMQVCYFSRSVAFGGTSSNKSRSTPRSSHIISHELAHMWFGNSVSPTFWHELWLNEGLATWLADFVAIESKWSSAERRSVAVAKQRVHASRCQGRRAVRQPIQTQGV